MYICRTVLGYLKALYHPMHILTTYNMLPLLLAVSGLTNYFHMN